METRETTAELTPSGNDMNVYKFGLITVCGLITAFAMAIPVKQGAPMNLSERGMSVFEKGLSAELEN